MAALFAFAFFFVCLSLAYVVGYHVGLEGHVDAEELADRFDKLAELKEEVESLRAELVAAKQFQA